ncbi:hypothetical protein FNH22_07815 [Fulvivirga sp. M361]|uniref:hypothetical protein n=1 Tax=Fulvivirga sp. M361 TaxID=2594266 RepID=UPI001179B03D|nr:hypothetical protein [Fulvivirga sp. M361]TRX59951.1 hypothetical protein FNH22_07815 [Fulvivirga sp. M361]
MRYNDYFCGFAFLILTFVSCAPLSEDDAVNIWLDAPIGDNYIGNGVQWSAYPHADSEEAEWRFLMSPSKFDTLIARLDKMRPPFIRIMDQATWRYYKGMDTEGNPIIDFTTQEVKTLYKLLDYCQKNDVTVVFGEWGSPNYDVEDKPENHITDATDPRWIEMIGEYLNHLIIEKGYTCIKYYNLINEPNGNWASTDGDYEQWAAGVVLLKDELEKRGLGKHLSITGPGTVPQYNNPKTSFEGWEWTTRAVKDLDMSLGAYEVHAYLGQNTVKNGEVAEFLHLDKVMDAVDGTGKQFFLGEIGMKEQSGQLKSENDRRIEGDPYAGPDSNMRVYDFDYGVDMVDAAIQCMNCGVDGLIVWDLDDAMHTSGDTGDTTLLKRWGFWNILGTEVTNNPADEEIRPWFYPWSWMSKYFPKGATILKSDATGVDGVRLVAAGIGDKITIAVVNNTETAQDIKVKIPRLGLNSRYDIYRYEEPNYNAKNNKLKIPKVSRMIDFSEAFNIHLVPTSVLVLTSLED